MIYVVTHINRFTIYTCTLIELKGKLSELNILLLMHITYTLQKIVIVYVLQNTRDILHEYDLILHQLQSLIYLTP